MLVDGKRLMPANGDGVADLNIIPSALIESVEIITGGASAVYGSDALAGVVNFKLKRDFDGVEIDGTWGQTDRGDGTQYEAGLTAGTELRGRPRVDRGLRGLRRSRARHVWRPRLLRIPDGVRRRAGRGTLGPGARSCPADRPVIEEGRVQL